MFNHVKGLHQKPVYCSWLQPTPESSEKEKQVGDSRCHHQALYIIILDPCIITPKPYQIIPLCFFFVCGQGTQYLAVYGQDASSQAFISNLDCTGWMLRTMGIPRALGTSPRRKTLVTSQDTPDVLKYDMGSNHLISLQ